MMSYRDCLQMWDVSKIQPGKQRGHVLHSYISKRNWFYGCIGLIREMS